MLVVAVDVVDNVVVATVVVVAVAVAVAVATGLRGLLDW